MTSPELYDECLKVVVDFGTATALTTLLEAPNTFDADAGRFVWKQYDCMEYALIPREFQPGLVRVDLYLTMDEDDVDDIDLPRFVPGFLDGEVLQGTSRFTIAWLSEPEEWRVPVEIGRCTDGQA